VTRPKGAPVDSVETARAASRELHETIKDARAALHALHAIQVTADARIEEGNAIVDARIQELQEHLDSEAAKMQAAMDDTAVRLQDRIAVTLGAESAEQMLAMIVESLLVTIRPAIVQLLDERLPGIVMATLKEMVADDTSAHAARAAGALKIGAFFGTGGTVAGGTRP
jgi:hypothetical protein